MRERNNKYKCLIVKNSSGKIYGAFNNNLIGRDRARKYIISLQKRYFDDFVIVKE